MGTRNLVCVFLDGEYKVAQYGQWDGYPEGQGKTVLDFLRSLDGDYTDFADKVRQVVEVSDETIHERYISLGANAERLRKDGLIDCGVAEKFSAANPSLSRNTGGKILEYINNSEKPVEIRKTLEFAADSLFCEWCYVVDLDKKTFEVFKGFNEAPLVEEERFSFLTEAVANNSKFEPVKSFLTFYLDYLPTPEDFFIAAKGDVGDVRDDDD